MPPAPVSVLPVAPGGPHPSLRVGAAMRIVARPAPGVAMTQILGSGARMADAA
eukprot:CAMPEP_0172195656 /NCGR_PEP_ID=MMETSP1050-20130122/26337_1 /TAXON_ID=233186 /ORGANISM="Cryptomonas curvata, Strain CCAP979/52" /LENGTH=52 /DNA_ID=CAMNT_0012871759 /DNA_START=333 /DNA_END=487 /DNA_ORIENTATION=+